MAAKDARAGPNAAPRKILVAGAGGFVGHNLVRDLKRRGHWVRGVDIKAPEFEASAADEFQLLDLRDVNACQAAVKGVDDVYQLAADMGGIGYITSSFAQLSRNNVLINANMLEAAKDANVQRYLYTSSACVYPAYRQETDDVAGLREEDAMPADPEKGYGWEKLFSEELTKYFSEDHGLDVRIVRFHNIYGPYGAYDGGREKSPAAIMRKVALADDGGTVEVWGDGQQTRSYCHVDDCVEGVQRLMDSGFREPLNLGTEERVTINQLVELTAKVAGKRILLRHDLTKPQGVRGRNSDNARLRQTLGWEPGISLENGIRTTYSWIWSQLALQGRAKPPAPAQAPMAGRGPEVARR